MKIQILCGLVGMFIAGAMTGCASLPATFTDESLSQETLKSIQFHDLSEEECEDWKIMRRQVLAVTKKGPTYDQPSQWVERWTVNRCGEPMDVQLTYRRLPAGGTMIGVKKL